MLSLFVTFLTSCKSAGQTNKSAVVEVVQEFKPSRKYQYEVQKRTIDSRQIGSDKITTTTGIEFSVLSDSSELKECIWRQGLTRIVGIDPSLIDEETSSILNLHQGLELKFTIDHNGRIHKILNFEQCKQNIENGYKHYYDKFRTQDSPDDFSEIADLLKITYETEEALMNKFFPEVLIFFSLFGETIKSDTAYVSTSAIPNPFGGDSMMTSDTIKIERIKDDIVTISMAQGIPESAISAFIDKAVSKFPNVSDEPLSENKKSKSLWRSFATYSYDNKAKCLKQVALEKNMELEGDRQTQILKILSKN